MDNAYEYWKINMKVIWKTWHKIAYSSHQHLCDDACKRHGLCSVCMLSVSTSSVENNSLYYCDVSVNFYFIIIIIFLSI